MEDLKTIAINKVGKSRLSEVNFDALAFGREFSDHMFVMDYSNGAWHSPKIVPYAPIQMSPAASVIHYGQSIFEGLKAYRLKSGEIAMFRPDQNLIRMNQSAERMCMPNLPEDLVLEGLKELVKLDQNWIPTTKDGSLYIRPYMFATDEFIGVKASETYRFIIFTCPVAGYYSAPVKVKIELEYSRACPGGTGAAKAAGNYAASLYPAKIGREEGYDQLLWTDALTHEYFEESGTMNLMFVIDGKVYTPETSGTILSGITRKSVIEVMKEWGVEIIEGPIKVSTIVEAMEQGKLEEAFGVGTAATIAQIKAIGFKGTDYDLPAIEGRVISNKIANYMNDLRTGIVPDNRNWMVTV